jgi:hypothetical protein
LLQPGTDCHLANHNVIRLRLQKTSRPPTIKHAGRINKAPEFASAKPALILATKTFPHQKEPADRQEATQTTSQSLSEA